MSGDVVTDWQAIDAEWKRLRRIEAAAREAVDAAGTDRWPVNCDRLRMALDVTTPSKASRGA